MVAEFLLPKNKYFYVHEETISKLIDIENSKNVSMRLFIATVVSVVVKSFYVLVSVFWYPDIYQICCPGRCDKSIICVWNDWVFT